MTTPPETTADFEALLANVFAHPDDDLARLVFADYVEDRGDTDRAEFIRLQIDTARKGEKYPGKRESQLMATLFGGALKFGRDRFEPHRGFLTLKTAGEVFVLGAQVPPGVTQLFRAGWVDRVAVLGDDAPFDAATVSLFREAGCLDLSRNRIPPASLANMALAVLPMLTGSRLCRVLVHRTNADDWAEIVADPDAYLADDGSGTTRHYENVTAAQFARAVQRDRFVGATEVFFSGSLSAEVCRLFAESPTVAGVKTLGIRSLADPLGAEQVASIVDSPHLTQVVKLTVSVNAIEPQASALLSGSEFLRRLVDLDLTACSLNDGDFERVISGAPFPRLRSLSIWGNLVAADTLHRLCVSGRVPKLASITVPDTSDTGIEWLRLALQPRKLALAINVVGVRYESVVKPGGLRLVVTLPQNTDPTAWPAGADRLDWSRYAGVTLHSTLPDAPTLQRLVTTFRAARLTCLGVQCYTWGLANLNALADALPAFRLERLDLSQSHLDTAQVAVLLNALNVATLKHLEMRSMPYISSAAVKELAKRLPKSLRVEW